MTAQTTAYYIATVWLADTDPAIDTASWDSTRRVIRLLAAGPEDFRRGVLNLWPTKRITFGPISRSKLQP